MNSTVRTEHVTANLLRVGDIVRWEMIHQAGFVGTPRGDWRWSKLVELRHYPDGRVHGVFEWHDAGGYRNTIAGGLWEPGELVERLGV